MKTSAKQSKYSWALLAVMTIPARAADNLALHWEIAEGMTADKAQAVRIYESACAWIEDHFTVTRAPVKPLLTIHVGESCPDKDFLGPCYSSATSDLYLPEWDNSSPSAIAHATLIAGLMQLMDRKEMRRTVATLLSEEAGNFFNARNLTNKVSLHLE